MKIKYIPVLLLILLAGGWSLYAAELEPSAGGTGIIFPVPELGNCASKEKCHEYCEDLEHMDACIIFAKGNGLMNEEEAQRAESFREDLEDGGGPGSCATALQCENYCSNIRNLHECMAFAEEHGHEGDEVEDGKKIEAYLSSGGKMPGGCSSREVCENYCSDIAHMEECITFAEEVGIGMRDGHTGEDLSPEQLRDVLTRMSEGKTPGACKSKNECEAYCEGGGHFEECMAFAEEMGLISAKDLEMARKTGGKGPGGCNSRSSCETFCNNPDNQQICFEFGKEKGILHEDDMERMRDGAKRMHEGLDQAPPEARDCVESVLGVENMTRMMSGNFAPGREMTVSLQECFQNMRPPEAENQFKSNFNEERQGGSRMQEPEQPHMDEGAQYQQQYEQQYQEQYREQYEKQYQERYEQQYQQYQNQQEYHLEGMTNYQPASVFGVFGVILAPFLR